MVEETRLNRIMDALEGIHVELERLRTLKEHELGVELHYSKQGGGPYVPSEAEAAGDEAIIAHDKEVSERGY